MIEGTRNPATGWAGGGGGDVLWLKWSKWFNSQVFPYLRFEKYL
jgi:hypothetical protein